MTSLTKAAIKSAFMKLLNEKPFGKITVKDIAEECGINRNSFYYHYSDIPALAEEIFVEEAEKLIQLNGNNPSIYENLLSAIDFALQNKKAMMHIYNSANRELFERYLNRVTERTVSEFVGVAAEKYGICDSDKEVIVMYYKSLLIGFVTDWLMGGMKYDLSDNIHRICELFEGTSETAFSRCYKINNEKE